MMRSVLFSARARPLHISPIPLTAGGGALAQQWRRTLITSVDKPSWRLLVRLLRVFKARHGHLRIKRLFKVPSRAEEAAQQAAEQQMMAAGQMAKQATKRRAWPRAAAGSPLGLWSEELRKWREYTVLPSAWHLASSGSGDDSNPAIWCPGKRSAARVQELDELGFEWDSPGRVRAGANRERWERRLLPCLRAFKAVYGHLNVPMSFCVPHQHPALAAAGATFDSAWPREAWGWELGRAVALLRRHDAPDVGLRCAAAQAERCTELLESRNLAEAEATAAGAEVVARKEQMRHGVVLHETGATEPAAYREMQCSLRDAEREHRLAMQHAWVADAYLQQAFASMQRREQLDQMGFVWCSKSWAWETFVLALRTYRDLYGMGAASAPKGTQHPHLITGVPVSFVVPERGSKAAQRWPPRTHGLALGAKVFRIGTQGLGKGEPPPEVRAAELNALGFVWDKREAQWEQVLAALRAYKALHGDVAVPEHFVVPCAASAARKMRRAHFARRKAAAKRRGVKLGADEEEEGGLEEGAAYEPPPHPFAGCVAGLALGKSVQNIRHRGAWLHGRPDRIAALEDVAVGFEWPSPLVREALEQAWDCAEGPSGLRRAMVAAAAQESRKQWHALCGALDAYKALHGDMLVPQKFVVPSDGSLSPPFTEEMRGFRLGHTVMTLRSQGNDILEAHPQRRQELDEMGFAWSAKTEAWEGVMSALEQWQQREGHYDVPLDFDVPLGDGWRANTWGIPLGRHIAALRAEGRLAGGSIDRGEQLRERGISL